MPRNFNCCVDIKKFIPCTLLRYNYIRWQGVKITSRVTHCTKKDNGLNNSVWKLFLKKQLGCLEQNVLWEASSCWPSQKKLPFLRNSFHYCFLQSPPLNFCPEPGDNIGRILLSQFLVLWHPLQWFHTHVFKAAYKIAHCIILCFNYTNILRNCHWALLDIVTKICK